MHQNKYCWNIENLASDAIMTSFLANADQIVWKNPIYFTFMHNSVNKQNQKPQLVKLDINSVPQIGYMKCMVREGNAVTFFFCGVGLTSPGTAATSGLLYSPRW
jgi:hypothetical protein